MAARKILLPYSFSSYDQKSLAFVRDTFVHMQDVQITLFYAHTSMPDIEMRGSPVMEKMKKELSYLSQQIIAHETELNDIKQQLVQNGFSSGQIEIAFKPKKKEIAAEIIDLAERGGFDTVVLHHKPARMTRFFTGTVFNKVVSTLKDKTICVVS